MIRPYKEAFPSDTIENVKSSLKNSGIFFHEQGLKSVDDKYFTCSLTIGGNKNLFVNGKGVTKEFCLASACGELMERLQNLIVLFNKIGLSNDYLLSLFPDSLILENSEEIFSHNSKEYEPDIKKINDDIAINPERSIVAAEFYDAINERVVLLPYSEIISATGSNGMCAGNSYAEAITQGICEVLERESLIRIFSEEISPPTIPDEFLKQSASYDFIKGMEAKDISIIVKDCSFGRGFPVLGVLILNKRTGKYRFQLGSHPVFNHALERSIGELCQNYDDIENLLEDGEEINLSSDPFGPANGNTDRDFWKSVHYLNYLIRGKGNLPNSFFLHRPTFTFTEWNVFEKSSSYREDLQIFRELFKEKGMSLYIRDVSFLGFPACYIYIPEFSAVEGNLPWNSYSHNKKIITFLKNRQSETDLSEIVFDLNNASRSELSDLIRWIKLHTVSSPYYVLGNKYEWIKAIFHRPTVNGTKLSIEYLLSLLYLKAGDYEHANKEANKFIQRNQLQPEDRVFLSAFRDCLHFLSQNYERESIIQKLSDFYDKDSIVNILSDIGSNKKIFDDTEIPDVVDHENATKGRAIFEQLKGKITSSQIDQSRLGGCFKRV